MEQYAQQAQEVAAQQLAARQAVGLGCAGCGCAGVPCGGMGDYLQNFHFPIPQYITPGNPRGLGDFQMTAPGGYFATWDVSQWGAAEWGTAVAGLYFLSSLWGDTKRTASKARKLYRRRAA
jgi:hypothetical protein